MIRRPPRSTRVRSSAASDVYKRQCLESIMTTLERYKRTFLSNAVSDIERISSSYNENDIQFSFEDLTEGGGVDDSIDEEQPFLFDVAWEVARKVGGIYTVLRSKAPITVKEYGDSYALIGPYNAESAAIEFEPLDPSPLTASVINYMRDAHKIQIYFGRWLVKGYPRVFLIDVGSSVDKLAEWKRELMFGFEPANDEEVNQVIVFGYQTSLLLQAFNGQTKGKRIIAHFHEWLAAVALIVIKRKRISIATVFTTHATLLGRYLAAGGVDLYHRMEQIHPDSEANNRGIYARHWIERSAAHGADVFTTVSDITAYEAEYLLGKKADVIVPNGLTVTRFTALHEFQNLHLKCKNQIYEFLRGHFYGYYDFNIDKTLVFFTAGRYEYQNKGVDIFLDGLALLNKRLKAEGSDVTVVAFIIMPTKTNNFNVDSLKGQSVIKDLRVTCDAVVKNMAEKIFESTLKGNVPNPEELISTEDIVMLKRRIFALKQRATLPPIVTHNMIDENDVILNRIRTLKMFNYPADRVKIIYHPQFLDSTNPLLPMDYTDFVRGTHLGVFPSYYEPWGYTPAECTILGVPSITSNLTGFGSFISQHVVNPSENGIFIVDRRFKPYHESVEQLSNYMYDFTKCDRRGRIEMRNKVEKLSDILDWKSLNRMYMRARGLAYERAFKK
eukprot:TRINITY_DN835_c0_g1_i1.p1 TRINITY_DN835_c0_g1~~TRINITY_DN835_c0_g1_i1.p1  ORF type:complete len:670 (+),score=117.80 TRINITY_DN835_c0_g1_i1:1-2010(+)